MNIAIILAGGLGKRMGSEIPKQFIKILGKPVIIYTLEVFENNPEIDAIEVVCVADYIEDLWSYSKINNITKLKWIIPGGDSCQDSIRNGVINLEDICKDEDIILLAMSVSPLIDDEIISDSLAVCRRYGNAIAGSESIYNFSKLEEGSYANSYILKEKCITLNMPWTFRYKKLLWAYKKAYSENIATDANSYTPTLMIDLGETIYFSKDSQKNKLKLTTFDDLDLFEGYLILNKIRNSHKGGNDHEIFSRNR